ncbi:MAG: FecR family protein, partial [Chloroflexota bacterium]
AQLQVGGEARTNETGKARLDLLPDGTILRLPPNSSFKLTELQGDQSSPFTRLGLFFGKIFIILSGGELEVETPSGVAAVRGSMMSVYYDPETGNLTATCLEGHCSLRNDKGVIELAEGQAADIRDGVLSNAPRALTDAELLDWLNFVPETDRVLDRLPRLRQLRDRIREIIPPRRRP